MPNLFGLASASQKCRGFRKAIVCPDHADFNAEKLSDTIVLLPLGNPGDPEIGGGVAGNCNIGEVRIVSGATGQVTGLAGSKMCLRGVAFDAGSSTAKSYDPEGGDFCLGWWGAGGVRCVLLRVVARDCLVAGASSRRRISRSMDY
ncbi:MAG: hypothetical protein SGJ09_04970 [Phycisphaerae bacterium]|nr:hypothetical protein [Phycisphaerae bacterium]